MTARCRFGPSFRGLVPMPALRFLGYPFKGIFEEGSRLLIIPQPCGLPILKGIAPGDSVPVACLPMIPHMPG